MIIVNDKRNMIIFSDALIGINVHQNEPNVMCSFKAVGSKDKILGKYSDKGRCEKVIQSIARAFDNDDAVFYMPDNADKEMNTVLRGGGIESRKVRTTGKTK